MHSPVHKFRIVEGYDDFSFYVDGEEVGYVSRRAAGIMGMEAAVDLFKGIAKQIDAELEEDKE